MKQQVTVTVTFVHGEGDYPKHFREFLADDILTQWYVESLVMSPLNTTEEVTSDD